MSNRNSNAGTAADSSTPDEVTTSSQTIAKPTVSGSLLLLELMQVAAIKNEDGMSVVNYVDKPNGGSVAYLRHDAVVKRLNSMLEYQFPTIDEAGVIAVEISESVTPELTAREQAFFVAGFKECVKLLSGRCNDR